MDLEEDEEEAMEEEEASTDLEEMVETGGSITLTSLVKGVSNNNSPITTTTINKMEFKIR